MEKKGEASNAELPIKEIKYSQSVEEMSHLVLILKEQMKECPNEDILFILIETIDYYALLRHFKIKSKTTKTDTQSINKFKDNLLTNISHLESFTVIPTLNTIEIEAKSQKGNKFNSPKIYDINGEEINLGIPGRELNLFLYDNVADLNSFIIKNNNINTIIFCLSINMNFFETKKWIKNNGLLNNKIFNFCFTEIAPKALNTATNLRLSRLPRIAIIGADGLIREDKCIKNVNSFDLQKDLFNKLGEEGYNREEQAKNNNFIYLDNENKRNIVKSMNVYLKKNGLNNVHFYVNSKICINKKGVKKTRCYPVFCGEANIEEKNMVDNLIDILNGQQLFNEIQCIVKYNGK